MALRIDFPVNETELLPVSQKGQGALKLCMSDDPLVYSAALCRTTLGCRYMCYLLLTAIITWHVPFMPLGILCWL